MIFVKVNLKKKKKKFPLEFFIYIPDYISRIMDLLNYAYNWNFGKVHKI